jgi:hypothetical protein
MAYYKRSPFGGSTLYFTKEETSDIADGASAVAVVAAAIPDSTASKVVAAAAGLIALLAKRAERKDQILGVVILHYGGGPVPMLFDEVPKSARAL